MALFWLIIYNLCFPLFWFIFFLSGLFNQKLRDSLNGRNNLFRDLTRKLSSLTSAQHKRIWIHASSVGEFEQARPVIHKLKQIDPSLKFIATFSSISGYNARKNNTDVDVVSFLPLDFFNHARRFISLVKPEILILVRYDYWFNHLFLAHKNNVKLYLIAGVLREDAVYLKPFIKGLYRQMFAMFEALFTATAQDADRFNNSFDLKTAQFAGDPRFDQVIKRSRQLEKINYLKPYYEGKRVLVAGSTWEKDEALLIAEYNAIKSAETALIIAPHEVDPENIKRLKQTLAAAKLTYQTISDFPQSFNSNDILIIDQIGFLAELYALADAAYIGGGFGVNVHNTLEAAVYGLPVIYGPTITKSLEAKDLAELGGGFIVHDQPELRAVLNLQFLDAEGQRKAGEISRNYVRSKSGATDVIVSELMKALNFKAQTTDPQ